MAIPMPHWRLSVEDYYRMAEAGILHEDDRVELIDGEILALPPIGSDHAGTVDDQGDTIRDLVRARPGDTLSPLVFPDVRIAVSDVLG